MKILDLFGLTGKVALVTGGSVGLGAQMALALAEAGADVVITARKLDRCQAEAEKIARDCGVRTMALSCNVSQESTVVETVSTVLNEWGKIDILVNNAGTTWGAPAESFPTKGWQKVIDVNLTGTFFCCREVGRAMIRQGGGKIINISSVAGLTGAVPEKMDTIAYQASKAGVIGLTRDLAAKWARYRINVNAIAPGWFPTEMTAWSLEHCRDAILSGIPMGRFGGDDELKGAVVYLASDASRYVTGICLSVDGGESAI